MTIASWCKVPRAPLYALGAISPMYMGTNPEVNPETNITRSQLYFCGFSTEWKLFFHLSSGSLLFQDLGKKGFKSTTVETHNSTTHDDHDVGHPHLTKSHQKSSYDGQKIDH